MKLPNHWLAVFAITGKGCLLFALILALLPSSLEAECAQWDVAIDWGLQQSDGILVHMELAQERGGTNLSGRASYSDKIHAVRQQGDVKGTVQGNKFDLRVVWRTGNVGLWNGTILPSGIIQGRCSDENVRSYKATFVSDGPMRCVNPPPPQLPPPPPLTDNIKRGSFVILQVAAAARSRRGQ